MAVSNEISKAEETVKEEEKNEEKQENIENPVSNENSEETESKNNIDHNTSEEASEINKECEIIEDSNNHEKVSSVPDKTEVTCSEEREINVEEKASTNIMDRHQPMEVDLTQGDDDMLIDNENINRPKRDENVEDINKGKIEENKSSEHSTQPDDDFQQSKHASCILEDRKDEKTCDIVNEKRSEEHILSKDDQDKKGDYDREQKENVSSPPIVILDDVGSSSDERKQPEVVELISGNTTPRLDHSVEAIQPATPINPGSVKQTPPQPEIPSMGVYTPDSTTNSVHSLHGYGQCDLDVSQLGLESPTSISSNDMPPSVTEPPRPPSSQAYTDCAQQGNMYHHHQVSSPQHCATNLPQYQPAPVKQSSSSRSKAQNVSQHHARNRSTPPAPSPAVHRSTPPQQSSSSSSTSSSRHHQQSYHHHPHHAVISQANYGIVSQMAPSGSYVGVPMTTVIQHRMSAGGQQPPSQRLGSSPSCSVSTPTNFYIQNIQTAMHPHSHTPTPSPTACSMGQGGQSGTPSCSLAKLQQLTNGLDMIPPGHCTNMTPPPPMNLTPPPPPTHPTMTPPPPTAHQMLQQSNLNYHKYFPSNMAPSSGRSSRGSSSVQMTSSSSSSRSGVSPNVTINPNLISQYSSFNGYRMPGQQSPATVTGYITNTASFINQGQIPVQMGVMNMAQSQYSQDPATLQQNTMYTTYGYINGNLLNSTLRR